MQLAMKQYWVYGMLIITLARIHCIKGQAGRLKCNCSEHFCHPNCDFDNNECCQGQACFVRYLENIDDAKDYQIDYGCLDYVGNALCKDQSHMNCCQNYSFCNVDLLIPSPIPYSLPSPSPTISLSNKRSNKDKVILASTLVPVSILLVMMITSVVFLLYFCHHKRTIKRRVRTNGAQVPNSFNDTEPHKFIQEIDPVPVSLADITISCTSGSGGGMPRLVERTIARGTILGDVIGGGRFGQVYIGYYQGETYAVKKFFSRDEMSWFREREIYNSFNMRHENILMYVAADILSNNGVTELWLITQFHPKGSLFDELHRDAFSLEKMIKYIYSASRGMSYLHMDLPGSLGKPSIAHRDIKSKNMLVKNDSTLCIADFGLAVAANSPVLSKPENLRQGTKRYMAPELLEEIINPKNFDSFTRTDIYSFGIVLWEICCRCNFDNNTDSAREYELPFEYDVPHDPSFDDMKNAIVLKGLTPDTPDAWNNNELFKRLERLMTECWYKNPTARPTSFHIRKKIKTIVESSDLKLSIEM